MSKICLAAVVTLLMVLSAPAVSDAAADGAPAASSSDQQSAAPALRLPGADDGVAEPLRNRVKCLRACHKSCRGKSPKKGKACRKRCRSKICR